MAFPTTISAGAASFIPSGSEPGPIQVGNDLYCVAYKQPANTAFNMFKSTDQAQTWSKVGGDSVASVANTQYNALAVGTVIYIFCVKSAGPANKPIQVIPFDTVAGTFGAAIVTAATYSGGGSNLANAHFAAAYRAFDNSVVCCVVRNVAGLSTVWYSLFNIGTLTMGAQTQCGDLAAIIDWDCAEVLVAGLFTQLVLYSRDFGNNHTSIYSESLSNANALGAIQTIDSGVQGVLFPTGCTDGTTIVIACIPVVVPSYQIHVFSGVSAEPVVYTQHNKTYTEGNASVDSIALALVAGITYLLAFGLTAGGPNPDGYYQDSGAGFGAFTTLNAAGLYSQVKTQLITTPTLFWGAIAAGSIVFFGLGGAPPPPAVGSPTKKNVPEPVSLPDSRVLCKRGQQKRCIDELTGMKYTMQASKGVYCAIQ